MRAESKDYNLKLSVNKYIDANLSLEYAGLFNYGNVDFSVIGLDRWFEIDWFEFPGTKTTKNDFAILCYNNSENDKYNWQLERMAANVRELLNVNSIELYDFETRSSPERIMYSGVYLDAGIRFVHRSENEIFNKKIYKTVLNYQLIVGRMDIII